MGYYYAELEPPAILFDNPGMTFSEFNSKVLNNDFPRHKQFISEPIYFLPRILGLPTSQSFEEFKQSKKDPKGLPLYAPTSWLLEKPYKVKLHIRNELSAPKTYKNIEFKKIKNNQTTYLTGLEYWPLEPECLVNRVISMKEVILSPDDLFYCEHDEEKNNVFGCEFEGQEIKQITEVQDFESIEELFREWPQFRPENRFDLSIPNGVFVTQNILQKNFRWKQIKGRYYFDEKSFDLMPAGSPNIRSKGAGYTDLIITAEVIKNKGVRLNNFRARDEGEEDLQSTINQLPEISRRRIETAIWDAHTSTFAKENNLTYFEMFHLRARHDSP